MTVQSQQTAPIESQGFSHAWRALRHRNFRLFVSGQAVSMIGTWMTRIATAWLVYRLTKSPWMLGSIGFANQIPSFLLAPVAGVIIDRIDRRRLLILAQALLMVHALTLATLTLTNHISIPLLFLLSTFQGIVNAFEMPTRQSFTVRMVGNQRLDLSNAIAINSSMMNSTRLIGPALAGILISATSEGWCFLFDGLSFIAVIASLLMMRMPPAEAAPTKAGVFTQMREGWDYVSSSFPLRSMLMLFAVTSLIGWPFTILMPVFAAQVLHGGPHTLGFLMGALGLGAFISAIGLILRRSVRGLLSHIPQAALLFGVSLILFGFSRWFWLSFVLLLLCGFGMLRGNNATNTIMQTIVDEDMRGRVMSYYTMGLEGLAPWGSLIAGAMARSVGATHAVMISGSIVILGALWFWLRLPSIRTAIRPIYEELGIRPKAILIEEPEPQN
jgi:MFS family permease